MNHVWQKKTKEPQLPLYGMIGKGQFGRFADMKDPLEDENEQNEAENVAEEPSMMLQMMLNMYQLMMLNMYQLILLMIFMLCLQTKLIFQIY